MYKSITISAQLLALADRLGFGKICSGENADKRYRHFTARPQLYAMMIAQLTGQKGLRTIEETIASDNDLYHAGVSTHITRSNLAHANDPRLRTNIHLRQESFFWRKKLYRRIVLTFHPEKNRDLPDANGCSKSIVMLNLFQHLR